MTAESSFLPPKKSGHARPPAGPFSFTNNNSVETAGVELAVRWKPFDYWQLHASYSYLHVSSPEVGVNPGGGPEGRDPEHQFQIRSYLDVTEDLELNAALYFVDGTQRFDANSYARLDLGLTWRPFEQVALSVWGQNLTDNHHRESGVVTANEGPAEIQRGVYGRVSLSF
ncbi:MAG: TonB-dependent receptor [Deltaproteobacteria bacterium]|nr:TonB-dependent receptor [Deltaproteobacteria bacterium]